MARPLPFQILRDLAAESMEKAFESVGKAVAAEKASREQLSRLREYRYDYLERLQLSMQQGVRSSVASNSQRFIDTIDEAIARQQTQVQALEQDIINKREVWLQERRKVESMGALLARGEKKQALVEGRREQKNNDEYASRAYRRMQMA